VTDEHERNLELLAGYALIALEGPDAEEADRLLSDHVPWCVTCRGALADFRDLMVSSGSPRPADRRSWRCAHQARDEDVPVRRRRGVDGRLVASVAALLGMAGFTLSLGSRATWRGRARHRARGPERHAAAGADPALEASSTGTAGRLIEVSDPGLEHMYLYGDQVPEPAEGNGFQLWLGGAGAFDPLGDPFVPQGGVVLLRLTVDPSRYDEILITEEPLGVEPEEPTLGDGHTWRASI
jgi:hypothetical protein